MKSIKKHVILFLATVLPLITMAKPEKAGPDYSIWNKLLEKHVSSKGQVDYKGFKEDAAQLDIYLEELAQNPVQSDWPRAHKMAYWINAYNAFTVKLIVDNYPVKSIRNLNEGNPWDVKWIKLGNKTYSLNNIEHDILRPQFNDARIHFAVNCAAKSCPPLANQAFTANNLEELLNKQTRQFINNGTYNNLSTNEVRISKIFEWYKGDFGDIQAYLNKYADKKINEKAKVSYQEYDWALNN